MTLTEWKQKVEETHNSPDTEGAHVAEDKLHYTFFRDLISGELNPRTAKQVAKLLLTLEHDEKWYS